MAWEIMPKTWIKFSTRVLVQDRRDLAELRRMAQIVLDGVKNDYRTVVTWRTKLGKVKVLEHLNVLRWRLPDERDYDYDMSLRSPLLHAKANRTYFSRVASLRLLARWESGDTSCVDDIRSDPECVAPERALVRYEYDRNLLWVTPGALVQPLFYSGAEPHINLATLGALLAYELWSAARRHVPALQPPGDVSSFEDEVSCLVTAYRNITNDTTPAEFVATEIYSRQMALRTVMDSARKSFQPARRSTGRWPDVGEAQLLFVRYCSLFCARQSAGRTRVAQCDVPVASMPEFASLFRCGRVDNLGAVAADCGPT
ncbi:uncharacterized protein [Dermacentor andersoni]|uniref:uncharacterized protein n=1 Tax=Dermacentor andersoni TaxID=34620 RepID=UPI003B3A80AC